MPYVKWHSKVEKKVGQVAEKHLATRVAIFSAIMFGLVYFYINNTTPYNPFNKALADTSVLLIGISMLLSSVCYFWDFADTKIIYRKHLGLAGIAFGLTHLIVSRDALFSLLKLSDTPSTKQWSAIVALIATFIFVVMSIISNRYAATKLGGRLWRFILRVGYLAIALIWVHIVLLKSHYWVEWWLEGPSELPSMSLLMSIFIGIVIVMRFILWASISDAKSKGA